MLTQVKNVKFYLQAKLGQRGAEMVEYAIVLACIAAVGVAYYATGTGTPAEGSSTAASGTLTSALSGLWNKISSKINQI